MSPNATPHPNSCLSPNVLEQEPIGLPNPQGRVAFRTLLAWLGSDDPLKINRAAEVLATSDAECVPRLLRVAIDKERSLALRVRLLAVIEHMKHPLPPSSWMDLFLEHAKTESSEMRCMISRVLRMHRELSAERTK